MPAHHQTTETATPSDKATKSTSRQPFVDPHATERAELSRQYDDVIQALLVQTGVDNIDHLLQLMRQQAIDEAESKAIQKEAVQLAGSKLEERLANFSISGIIPPEMQEVEPNIVVEVQPVSPAGATVEAQNYHAGDVLPWSEDSTPEVIGRTALTALQDLQAKRIALQTEANELAIQEQRLVLAAKDAGHFSWNSLAKVLGLTKSQLVNAYDPKTRATQRQNAVKNGRKLRALAKQTQQQAS